MSISAVRGALSFAENNKDKFQKDALQINMSSGEKISGIVSIISEYDEVDGKPMPVVQVQNKTYGSFSFVDPKHIVSVYPKFLVE